MDLHDDEQEAPRVVRWLATAGYVAMFFAGGTYLVVEFLKAAYFTAAGG